MPVFIGVAQCEPLHPSLQPVSQAPVLGLQDPFPLQKELHVSLHFDP